MQGVTILGATGSIGQSSLRVLRRNADRYRVSALAAHSSAEALAELCLEFQPDYAALVDVQAAARLRELLAASRCPTQVLEGQGALDELAADPASDVVIAAVVGAAGLSSTMSAIKAGKRILLANKESLVMSGALMMEAARAHGAELLPIDSEHNAIFQCLPEQVQTKLGHCDLAGAGVRQVLLTGSGGPFRKLPLEQLASVTVEQAIAHPNWSMGAKISVDSASMMNKGLEYIEARWLFNLKRSDIEVVIHPQSVIHSMVSFKDGSVLAQMGQPDMCTPIAHALAYPQRIDAGVEPLDLLSCGTLSFEKPDPLRYPCLQLAIEACWQGQSATTVLNAANEVAVAAFLEGRVGFTAIPKLCEKALAALSGEACGTLDDILQLDGETRRRCGDWLTQVGH
ncbi:1-deoxy-D-xylulose-5-phosphate reductoisomerase [Dongshaea marina]|uniref:1-deoxy-D-xylulose-5-phosphate reductoisomerase n=1 Tax=Dongshaea marina TaxID=2047966 RepID=UPI000D3EBCAD|nr:1-deoxy-D-xylulose-5-phosphate reductoisomerase [Dongshaea marina]